MTDDIKVPAEDDELPTPPPDSPDDPAENDPDGTTDEGVEP